MTREREIYLTNPVIQKKISQEMKIEEAEQHAAPSKFLNAGGC